MISSCYMQNFKCSTVVLCPFHFRFLAFLPFRLVDWFAEFAVFWALDHSDNKPLLPWFHEFHGSQSDLRLRKCRCQMDAENFHTTVGAHRCGWLPSRKLTYPTWGKGKSSSNMPYKGDMLIPWRVPVVFDVGMCVCELQVGLLLKKCSYQLSVLRRIKDLNRKTSPAFKFPAGQKRIHSPWQQFCKMIVTNWILLH